MKADIAYFYDCFTYIVAGLIESDWGVDLSRIIIGPINYANVSRMKLA
jgi:hypothetical protein